jgi:hypothetical protein
MIIIKSIKIFFNNLNLYKTNYKNGGKNLPPIPGVVEDEPKSGLFSLDPNKPVFVVVVELNKGLEDPNNPLLTAP